LEGGDDLLPPGVDMDALATAAASGIDVGGGGGLPESRWKEATATAATYPSAAVIFLPFFFLSLGSLHLKWLHRSGRRLD
jgi:hypothetical protein